MADPTDLPRTTRLPRSLHPFRSRQYRLIALSLAASLTGGGLWLVALVYEVIALGGGPVQLSSVSAAAAAGLVLAVLAGGIAADRLPLRAVLVGVETARACAAAVGAVLALTGAAQLWHLVVLAFAVGVAEGFYYPAYAATLPSVLPEAELLAANGVEGVLRPAAMQAAGPALAGLAVTVTAPSGALVLAASAYLVALVPLPFLRPVARPPASAASPLQDFREGVVYLRRTGWLLATLVFAVVAVLLILGPVEVLIPFAVRDRAHGGPADYALVLAAFGLGGAIGSIVVSSRPLPRRYLTLTVLTWGFGALPLVVLGVTDLLAVMVAATFVMGVTDQSAQVLWNTLLQRRVPRHMLGRVSSLDFFVSLALMPASMALAGPVGEALGLPLTFALAGAIPPVLAIAVILVWRLHRDELAHPLEPATAAGPAVTGP